MKTLTEFPGLNIKNAAKSMQELTAGGKTQEELPGALGEVLKLEGDRLNFMVNALTLIGTKLNDLKRVVVYSLAEGEKAPHGAIQKGDQTYLIEYYPSLNPQKPKRGDRNGRSEDPKKKGKGKRKGRGDRKRGSDRPGDPRRERRPERGAPATVQAPAQAKAQAQGNPGKPPVIIPKKPIPPKAIASPTLAVSAESETKTAT